ncbi:hypothetical protein McanCB49686_001329 [Microsporum canis]
MENYTPSHPVSPISPISQASSPSFPSSLKRYELGLSDKAIEAAPLPKAVAPRLSIMEVPRRKPVPPSKPAFVDQPEPHVQAPPAHSGRLIVTLRSNWAHRRKRVIIIATVMAVLLLGLIIGFQGLMIPSRAGAANLPLPTNNGGPYVGELTYYDPALGACGITSSSSEAVCAVSKVVFDAASTGPNPNTNPLCGRKIRLRRNGKSVDVTVVDRCVGCKSTDIDATITVFQQLAHVNQGRVDVQWAWLDKPPGNP